MTQSSSASVASKTTPIAITPLKEPPSSKTFSGPIHEPLPSSQPPIKSPHRVVPPPPPSSSVIRSTTTSVPPPILPPPLQSTVSPSRTATVKAPPPPPPPPPSLSSSVQHVDSGSVSQIPPPSTAVTRETIIPSSTRPTPTPSISIGVSETTSKTTTLTSPLAPPPPPPPPPPISLPPQQQTPSSISSSMTHMAAESIAPSSPEGLSVTSRPVPNATPGRAELLLSIQQSNIQNLRRVSFLYSPFQIYFPSSMSYPPILYHVILYHLSI